MPIRRSQPRPRPSSYPSFSVYNHSSLPYQLNDIAHIHGCWMDVVGDEVDVLSRDIFKARCENEEIYHLLRMHKETYQNELTNIIANLNSDINKMRAELKEELMRELHKNSDKDHTDTVGTAQDDTNSKDKDINSKSTDKSTDKSTVDQIVDQQCQLQPEPAADISKQSNYQ